VNNWLTAKCGNSPHRGLSIVISSILYIVPHGKQCIQEDMKEILEVIKWLLTKGTTMTVDIRSGEQAILSAGFAKYITAKTQKHKNHTGLPSSSRWTQIYKHVLTDYLFFFFLNNH